MDLKEQQYVCALAEYQNLTRAAERLYISQPALSIFISKLEKNLGLPLFIRKNGKFILTYAGECYVEQAEKMLELERIFHEKLNNISCEHAGRIRIGASVRRSPWLLPPVLSQFEREWPEIDVVLREGTIVDLNELLDNYELDLIIVNLPDKRDDMLYRLLFRDSFLLAVPQLHPINAKSIYVPGERYRNLELKYLEGETLFVHAAWSSSRQIEDYLLEKNHITPGKLRVIRGTETSFQMIAEGLGIGFIRESYAVNMKYKKPVNLYKVACEEYPIDVVACYHKDLHLPDYLDRLLELLVERGQNMYEN